MTDPIAPEPEADASAAQQIEKLLLDRTFDGIVRVVRSSSPESSPERVQDAVCAVVARLVNNTHGPKDNIFQYLVNAARRELIDIHRREQRRQSVTLDTDNPDHDSPAPYTQEPGFELIANERGQRVLDYLIAFTKGWDNEGMALVTEIHLRATLNDLPLSPQEAADIASGVLDREVSPGTAAVWKSRGLARLARQIDPDIRTDEENEL